MFRGTRNEEEQAHLLEAAAAIRSLKGEILQKWEERCRIEISASRAYSSLALVDSLPEFLDQMCEFLRAPDSESKRHETAQTACEHGEQRSALQAYDIDHVILEYAVLRVTLLETLQSKGPVSPFARRLMHVFLDVGISQAAKSFMDRSQSQLNDALARESNAARNLKNSIATLEEVQEKLNKSIEVAGVGFYDWDIVQNRVSYSPQMKKEWVLQDAGTLEEALSLVHPEDRSWLEHSVRESIEKGTKFRAQYRVQRPDKKTIWIEAQGEATYDESGSPLRFFGTSINITEQKSVELALAEEQHKLATIFRESPAAMALWRGADMVFESVNPAYQDIFGDRELLGKRVEDAIPEIRDQAFPKLLRHVFETGESHVGHEELARLRRFENGPLEERYYDYTYLRICDAEGHPYGVYDHAIDVTERVLSRRGQEASQKKLREVVNELEKEQELRERFVATLSHDLRSPMAAARISAQLISRKPETSASLQTQLSKIVANIDRADQMIQKLLDVGRVQAGEPLNLKFTQCSLEQILNESIVELELIYGSRFSIKSSGPTVGNWSSDGIKRVIENLASNAAKYGETGTPITIETRQQGNHAILTVHNFGAPIAEEDAKHIFEPFKRSSSSERGNQRGWGLGLALVHAVAEAHGGRVTLRSSEAEGTTFSVFLPLNSQPEQTSP